MTKCLRIPSIRELDGLGVGVDGAAAQIDSLIELAEARADQQVAPLGTAAPAVQRRGDINPSRSP
jgi:hypothetical protein